MISPVQSPTIIFDHVSKQVAIVVGTDRRLVEIVESQRKQVATSGRPTS